jgi:non-specific protein-tyrosine kinase
MEFLGYAEAILRRWWLLVLFGILGLLIAFYTTSNVPRRYESAVTLQLNPSAKSALLPYSGDSNQSGGSPAGLAASYAEVLRSRSFGEIVVRQLGLTIPPESISNAIAVRMVPSTNIMRLSVTWDNPDDAQQLAQSVAEIFIAENVRRQEGQIGAGGSGGTRLTEMEETARSYQGRIEVLRRQRDQLDQALARGDLSRLSDLNAIDARLSALETSYANLLVEISRARSGIDTASVLDEAGAARPVGATSTSQSLLFGLLGGLAAAVALILFLNSLDDTIRSPEDVEAATGSVPLVLVGGISTRGWERRLRPTRLVMLAAHRSGSAEAFRTLRATLRLASTDRPFRTLVITSANPAEGKTLVASNLAVAFAQAGDRVLLVDADLRRPSLHHVFSLSNELGIADVLQQVGEPELVPAGGTSRFAAEGGDVAQPRSELQATASSWQGIVESGVENLWVVPSGRAPHDPSRLFRADRLAALIHRLETVWDVVIYDTAPVGPVADTLLLAAQADATLLVARGARTHRSALRAAMESIAQVGQAPLGVVLNDLHLGPLARYGRYSYSYYYSYGKHYYGADGTEQSKNGTNGAAHK